VSTPSNPAGQVTGSRHGALYRADGTTQLTASSVTALLTPVVNSDPPVTIAEDLYEARVFEGTGYPPHETILKFRAGQVVPTSHVMACFAAATVAGVAPATGAAAGGTHVTLTGSNFTPGTTVTVGGVAATGVTVDSPTQLRLITGAHAAGAVNVVVTNDAGAVTATGAFTYV
jgi:hypothetical protein